MEDYKSRFRGQQIDELLERIANADTLFSVGSLSVSGNATFQESISAPNIAAGVAYSQVDAAFVNGEGNPLFYLRQATYALAGLMTAADKAKMDGLPIITIKGYLTLDVPVEQMSSARPAKEAYWHVPSGHFVFKVEGDTRYFINCATGTDAYGENVGGAIAPFGGKVYTCEGKAYIYDGVQLRTPQDAITAMEQRMRDMINDTFVIG